MKRSAPIRRRVAPCHRGGSRFPKRRDPMFMAYMLEQLEAGRPCDGECGRLATARCHLDAKGSGGYDLGNVVLLEERCHARQEKRTEAFERETGVNLRAKARAWAEHYGEELAA